jgi:nicotinamidase-related amidase
MKKRRGKNTLSAEDADALIVVDLQHAFPVPPKIVNGVRRYSQRFKRRVFTRFVNPPGSQFRRLLKQSSCAPGTLDTALLLPPQKGDVVITKHGYGLAPRDIRRLKKLGVKRARVCGIDTDACVLGVMFSLFDAGIDCRAKTSLCWSSTSPQMHDAGKRIIEKQFPPPKRR